MYVPKDLLIKISLRMSAECVQLCLAKAFTNHLFLNTQYMNFADIYVYIHIHYKFYITLKTLNATQDNNT